MHRRKRTDRIVERLTQLAEAHARAACLLGEIVSALCEDLDLDAASIVTVNRQATVSPPARSYKPIPVANPDTLAVHWNGRTCFLGNTLAFKLFERLSRRPNYFFSHAVLLDDVWQCQVTKEAMRSVVKTLKQKLRMAGMEDLAMAIDGSRRECYGLMMGRDT